MMLPLKTQGMTEVLQLRKRVTRIRAMRRIGDADFKYLDERLAEIEARIVSMQELDEYGREA
jgi:hypothetical protein